MFGSRPRHVRRSALASTAGGGWKQPESPPRVGTGGNGAPGLARGVASPLMLELGHTTVRKPPFKYAAYTRVGFSDTDAQGIVYYGRYLPYFDLARVEYHRHLGLPSVGGEYEFVMRASSVDYLAPARFDDLLEVFIRPADRKSTRLNSSHTVIS